MVSRHHFVRTLSSEIFRIDRDAVKMFVGSDSGVFSVVFGLKFWFLVQVSVRTELDVLIAPEQCLVVIFRTLTVNDLSHIWNTSQFTSFRRLLTPLHPIHLKHYIAHCSFIFDLFICNGMSSVWWLNLLCSYIH